MLEIRNLSAGYPDNRVLSGLNLTVPHGTLTAIVGPNGCGKSTLLKAVTGILPSHGTILFRGTDLGSLGSAERAKLTAFLPQSRPVPEITAGRLVLHGRFPYLQHPRSYRDTDQQIAANSMEQLGITHLSRRYLPALSGGERQKVYLAMLLAQQTPVLLMDEPTTYLDIAHKFEIMNIAVQMARQGKTILMVLHDLDLAMNYAHRIAVMDEGAISMCAPPDEIFQSGILERCFHIRVGKTDGAGGVQYYFLPGSAP